MALLDGSIAYSCHNELDYRGFDLRVDALTDRRISGVAIPYERWQRVPDDPNMRAKGRRPRRRPRNNVPGASRFREKVRDGSIRLPTLDDTFKDSFAESLREQGIHDIKALINHDPKQSLGKLSDGSLKLSNKNKNLNFEIDLPDNASGNRVLESLDESDDRSLAMSVGFRRRGKRSNVVRKDYRLDEPTDDLFDKDYPIEERAIKTVPASDNRTPKLQSGLLDGSDYVEAFHPPTGRQWTVYFQLDLREVSVLIDTKPAWEGTYVTTGKQLNKNWRDRVLDMVGLRV